MKALFIDAIPSKVKIHTQDDTVTKVTTEVLFLSNKNIMSVSCFIITYNQLYFSMDFLKYRFNYSLVHHFFSYCNYKQITEWTLIVKECV